MHPVDEECFPEYGDESGTINLQDPSPWVMGLLRKNVISEIKPWIFSSRIQESSYKMNLAELQRMRLRKLQCKLAKHVTEIYEGREPKKWEYDLQQYVKALQDHDYMEKCRKSSRDPFLISGERFRDRQVLAAAMANVAFQHNDENVERTFQWEEIGLPIVGSRAQNEFNKYLKRVAVAGTGATFLIGPMWLMVLHRTVYTALVSTTIFIFVFGLIMAYVLEDNIQVLSSTAAYAAVLVVFVGLTTSS